MRDWLVREFRVEDAEHFPQFEQLGFDPHNVKAPSWTGTINGVPVACGGILFPRPKVGEAWIMVAPDTQGCGFLIARTVRKLVDGMLANGGLRRIQATVEVGNIDLERWMLFLGLQKEGCVHAIGDRGEDHWLYAKWKPRRKRR